MDSMPLRFHQMKPRQLEKVRKKFISRGLEQTCLIVVAEEDIVDPVCVGLCRLSKVSGLVTK